MKLISVVILSLALQAKASYLHDIKESMSSVENAFGKLLSDVVTDVRSTMHCTIFAMERVLAKHGVVSEPSNSNDCENDDENNNFDLNKEMDKSLKDFSQGLHSSISKVNETLSKVLDNDGHKRLTGMQNVFQEESMRLKKVSHLLRQELEKISHRIRTELQGIDLNLDKSSLDSISNNMKVLYEVQKRDKNGTEVNEIGQVFNEALEVLNIDTVDKTSSAEDKMKAIMDKLEEESNSTIVDKVSADRDLSSQREKSALLQNNGLDNKQIPQQTPRFKDMTGKMFQYNDSIRKDVDDYITDKTTGARNTKLKTVHDATESRSTHDYAAFDELEKGPITVIDEEIDIFENIAQTQIALDDFFSKDYGVDAFENSNLFDI